MIIFHIHEFNVKKIRYNVTNINSYDINIPDNVIADIPTGWS